MIIERYIVKEVFQTFLAVVAVLLLVFTGRHFARYLSDAAAGNLPGELVFKLLTTLTLSSLVLILPFALYLAVLLAFGRFYKDYEMTVMSACGIGIGRITTTILVLSLAFACVIALLSLYVAPWAVEQGLKIRDQAEARPELTGMVAGQFKSIGSGRRVYYVEQLSEDKKTMHNVFVNNGNENRMDIFSAKGGYQYVDDRTGDRFLVLLNGYRYEGTPGSDDFKIHEYQKSAVRIEQKEVQPRFRKSNAKDTSSLLGSNDPRDIAELQWRISMPLSAVLLGLAAVFLSRTTPRQGRYAKTLSAVFIYIIYNNLMGVGQSWVKHGRVEPIIGMWWVHLVLALFIFGLYLKQYGFKSLLRRAG